MILCIINCSLTRSVCRPGLVSRCVNIVYHRDIHYLSNGQFVANCMFCLIYDKLCAIRKLRYCIAFLIIMHYGCGVFSHIYGYPMNPNVIHVYIYMYIHVCFACSVFYYVHALITLINNVLTKK